MFGPKDPERGPEAPRHEVYITMGIYYCQKCKDEKFGDQFFISMLTSNPCGRCGKTPSSK